MRKFVALLALLASTLCSMAQKKDALLYHFTLTDTIGTDYSLNVSKIYRLDVSDPDKNGNRDLTCYLEDFRLKSNKLTAANMTDSSWETDWNSALTATMLLWHQPVHLKLYTNDSVSNILNEKLLKEALYKTSGLSDEELTNVFRLPLFDIREDMLLLFPALQKKKAAGENFMSDGVNYTVTESDKRRSLSRGKAITPALLSHSGMISALKTSYILFNQNY